MKGSYHILEEMTQNLKKIDGIVAYSIFQLPEKKEKRIKYLLKIIKLKKIFYGALENLEVKNKNDLLNIEEIWNIKNNLKFCIQNF